MSRFIIKVYRILVLALDRLNNYLFPLLFLFPFSNFLFKDFLKFLSSTSLTHSLTLSLFLCLSLSLSISLSLSLYLYLSLYLSLYLHHSLSLSLSLSLFFFLSSITLISLFIMTFKSSSFTLMTLILPNYFPLSGIGFVR